MREFLQSLQPELARLNTVIQTKLQSQVPLVEEIGEHLIAAGGKRLRPLLTLLAYRLAAGDVPADKLPDSAYELAAVLEFLHTATLLHDDVIDVSMLRRGRPTANATWGNAPSVLVGDFLYSRAFQMLVAISHNGIMAEIADTTNLIAEGEVLQLARAGQADTTEQQYLEVIHYKTARLFEAAARCGAMLAGAEQTLQQTMGEYGLALGMAFQLMDDYLDYAGNADIMGKNVGDDLAEGKPTLPLIRAMQLCADSDAAIIREAIEHKTSKDLARISGLVLSSGALSETIDKAQWYAQKASQVLQTVPNSATRKRLITLAELATARQA